MHGLPWRSQTLADALHPESEGISLHGITEVQRESVLHGSGGHLSLNVQDSCKGAAVITPGRPCMCTASCFQLVARCTCSRSASLENSSAFTKIRYKAADNLPGIVAKVASTAILLCVFDNGFTEKMRAPPFIRV